jgi:hypothetical protein
MGSKKKKKLKNQSNKNSEKDETNPDSSNTSSPASDVNELATQTRTKGNQEFRLGNYSNAVKCYTKAIALTSAIGKTPLLLVSLFLNRAISYLKLRVTLLSRFYVNSEI